jgi:NAD+ dependent glucose-6-phosphate dehydrogenase
MPETILITGGTHPIAAAAGQALRDAGHDVRTAGHELTDPAMVAPLVQGVSVVLHLAPLAIVAHPTDSGELLDQAARGTHVLYKAALDAGVERAVHASTLAVMDAYDDDLEVTEQWRPRPKPEPAHLAPYLAELVAREFTRDVSLERPLRVTCLRFAPLGAGPDDLTPAHAAEAIVKAVAKLTDNRGARGHRFSLLHVAAPTPTARYASGLATRTLGYATEGAPA